MIFNKVSGGAEKVTIDGKPAREKLDLIKTLQFLYNQQNKFPKPNYNDSMDTNYLKLSTNESVFFVNGIFGNANVYRGGIKKGWTLLGNINHMGGSNSDNKNNYYYLDKNDCIYYIENGKLLKRNLIDFTETIVSPAMSVDESKATMCIPFNDYVFVMSGKDYMYKIKNNIVTNMTSKVLNSGFPFYSLPVGVIKKDGYLYLVKENDIFKTKDLETWNAIVSKNGYYNMGGSVLFTVKDNTYLAAKNKVSDDETNFKVYKFENDDYTEVGLIKADLNNSFKYGLLFLYPEDDRKFYAWTGDRKAILLNDEIYKEREV